MKGLLFCVVVLFSLSASATISQVQSKATWAATGSSCQVTFNSNPTQSNLIAVWTSWTTSPPNNITVTSVKDQLDNGPICDASGHCVYASAVGPTVQSASSTAGQIFYAVVKNGALSDPVTVTYSGTVSSANCVIVEYSGLDVNYPLDSVSAAYSYSGGTKMDSGTAAPANASLLVFGAGTNDTGTASAGSGFTDIFPLTSNDSIIEQNTSAITSNNTLQRATGNLSASGNWVMQMAVFRDASWGLTGGSPQFTGQSLVSNNGVFTDTQMNTYAQSLVNGANPGAMFSGIQSHYATSPITGAVTTPTGNGSNCCAFGLMGLVENHTTFTGSFGAGTGVYGQSVCEVSSSFCEGGNFLATARGSSLTGLSVYGLELDVNIPSGLTATNLAGIIITGGESTSTFPSDASAILVTNKWQWPVALDCNHGSTSYCIFADGQTAGPTPSSLIGLQSWDANTQVHIAQLQEVNSATSGSTIYGILNVGQKGANDVVRPAGVARTYSTLPPCGSAFEGTMAPVTDSTTITWGATVSGSGTDHVMAYCDGANWTVAAK